MIDFKDNTGEEAVELDPVLDEEEFQDTDLDDEKDDVSGQNDFDDADETDENSASEDGDNGENTGTDDNASENSENDTEGKNPSDTSNTSTTKKPLSKQENAENAARRRREEFDAKLKEEHNRTVIAVLGGKNPYTGKEMTDGHDVEVYERMQRIKQAGGDPVADYATTLAEEKRQAEKNEREAKNTDFTTWAKNDAFAFARANPDVDMKELFQNETFKTIAEPLLKNRMPMSEIYKLYQTTQANIDNVNRTAKEKVKEAVAGRLANEKASAGSLKASGDATEGLYTLEQIKSMTDAQLDANWERVEKSLEKIYAKK